MSGWKDWTVGEVVNEGDFQSLIQDQVVQVYTDSTARGTALGTAVSEGMVSYLQDVNAVEVYDGSAWTSLATGDITSVTAGTGLSGGGTSGAVTLNADYSAIGSAVTISLSQVTDVTATATELNILDGATITTTELNYLDGATSNIQDQINSIGGGGGKILQVVSTHYTGTVSSNSATPTDVSGFSASITPSSTASKVLVTVHTSFGFDGDDPYPYILLTRNGTSIATGTAATGTRINTFLSGPSLPGASDGRTVYKFLPASKAFLDSPSSTSALTYQVQLAQPFNLPSAVGYLNRTDFSGDQVYTQFPSSTITLLEVGS